MTLVLSDHDVQQLLPMADCIDAMETAFHDMLAVEPDGVGCYYYWRNNANPARVWEMTRSLLRRVPRRQLHWHVIHSEPKEETQVS